MSDRVLMTATVPSMIGQFNMNNIRILQDLGYEVDVAVDFNDTSVWPKERTETFQDTLRQINVRCEQIDFSRSPFDIGKHIRSYRQTKALLKHNEYKFIHTHTPVASAIVRLAAHKTGTKVIYTAHGFHFYDGAPLQNWLVFYPIEWFLSRWTDVLVTINKEDYKRASTSFNAKTTVYIPGVGVDTSRFEVCQVDRAEKRASINVNDDDFMFLSVGELSDRKNHRVVIDAMRELQRENDLGRIVYVIVGKGDLEAEYENLVRSYRLENHVRMLGFRQDIDELCEVADCFIHPSVREGLGIAPLEAMASGLPLISANVNGMKDYTEDGISGCCIDPASVSQMVDSIRKMRDDASFRKECGQNNWRTARYFDIKNANSIMQELYELSSGWGHL